ncbi:MAG: sulfotransferase [Flavobacteriales bacterium]|nr:sulfotransferase [Flavobacteriales bacterium]MCB9166105.1 sulfotransferase [Flavobacteriales bacterium]
MSPSLIERARHKLRTWNRQWQLRSLRGRMHVDPADALLIFSQPRGGSTWLEEMVRTLPRTATIWEPLDLLNNPPFQRIGFWWRQYIPEDASWPEAEALFADLFAGRMLSPYLTRTSSIGELRAADRLVVKFVRGELLLPWLVRRFDLPRPVLLVRHPCAVVGSMIKFKAWEGHPLRIGTFPHPHQEFIESHRALLDAVRTPEERQAAMWCITTGHLLKHPDNDRLWTTITYEELVLRTKDTLAKVFGAWGLDVPAAALEHARRPSGTTLAGSQVHDPTAQLTSWQRTMAPEKIEAVLGMLDRSGIDLYGPDPMPRRTYTP